MSKLNTLFKIDIFKFFRWNFLSKNIIRDRNVYIVPFRHSVIDIDKTAIIELHSNLLLNFPEVRKSKRETILFVRENGKLIVNGKVLLRSGATLQVQHDASISIGQAYINHDATIIAGNHMKIGDGILISRNVTIFDSDFHKIIDREGNQINKPRDIEIGDHVWIGVNATLLRGSVIGDGAIISAGAVVGSKIKASTMAAGNPARSYSEVLWEA